jgi:hypothetical protein
LSLKENQIHINSVKTVEVAFFNRLDTLQVLGVEMSTGGSTESNVRLFEAFLTIYLSIIYYFFVSHLHPAARQFCRSTYTITDTIARSNEILGWEGVGNCQLLCFFKRYVLLGHNRNRFMVERPFYWCTKPTPTKLFIPLNYIEWSV